MCPEWSLGLDGISRTLSGTRPSTGDAGRTASSEIALSGRPAGIRLHFRRRGGRIPRDLCRTGSAGSGNRGVASVAQCCRRARPAALPARARVRRRFLRLPVCGRRRGSGIPAPPQPARAPPSGHRGRRAGDLRADHDRHPLQSTAPFRAGVRSGGTAMAGHGETSGRHRTGLARSAAGA